MAMYISLKKLKKELQDTSTEYLLITIQVINEIIAKRERKEKNVSKK